ncbi:FLJ37770-like protein [Trichonephila clavipes]|nr:FLJ37770-like protein [Trichonephila clavipes]
MSSPAFEPSPNGTAVSVANHYTGWATLLDMRAFIPVLEHPPYSPDLAPCDFYLFPKVKSALKGTRFESVEAVKEKAARVLKELTKDDFQHCFQQWKIRMERCRDREGVYIEGDNK